MKIETYRWGVFKASLDTVKGSEQRGTRPVLVVSDEDFNRVMPVVTILPLTSRKPGRKIYPHEVLLKKGTAGIPDESLILAHQIRTISKGRLEGLYGYIREARMRDMIRIALKIHLNLD